MVCTLIRLQAAPWVAGAVGPGADAADGKQPQAAETGASGSKTGESESSGAASAPKSSASSATTSRATVPSGASGEGSSKVLDALAQCTAVLGCVEEQSQYCQPRRPEERAYRSGCLRALQCAAARAVSMEAVPLPGAGAAQLALLAGVKVGGEVSAGSEPESIA